MHSHVARRVLACGAFVASVVLLLGCESGTVPLVSHDRGSLSLEQSGGGAIVVRGTGDPNVDVAAVQAAVDQGGRVLLQGHFSFDKPAAQPVAPLLAAGFFPPDAEVIVTKAVSISGMPDDDDAPATIDAGTLPFYVDAAGQHVSIEKLKFIRPTEAAIAVFAASGLDVASTKIEGLVPYKGNASGIWVIPSGGIPMPSSLGHPENVSGTLNFVHNDFDLIGGTSSDNMLGISVFGPGVEGAEVDVRVIGNRIRNVTEPAINFRRIVGRARIEHNSIATGSLTGNAGRNQAIRVANIGTYLIAHNSITCDWANADAEAIGVFSQIAAWPIQNAVVSDNDIDMAAPGGTMFTDFSAGIGVYGYANGNLVQHNRIRGHARAGITMPVFPLTGTPAAPSNNVFVLNRFARFTAALADYFVGSNAVDTRIIDRKTDTVDDLGTGTAIVQPSDERTKKGGDHR